MVSVVPMCYQSEIFSEMVVSMGLKKWVRSESVTEEIFMNLESCGDEVLSRLMGGTLCVFGKT